MAQSLSLGVISGMLTIDVSQFDLASTSVLEGVTSMSDAFGLLGASAEAMMAQAVGAFDGVSASVDAQAASVDALTQSYDRLAASMNAAQSGNIRAVPASYATTSAADAGAVSAAGSLGALDAAGAGADATLAGMDASAGGLDASLAGVDASAAGVDASLSGMASASGVSDAAMASLQASLDSVAGALAANTTAAQANTDALGANATAADAAATAQKGAASSSTSLADGFGKIQMPLMLAGAAVAAVGVASVVMAGNFQESMTQLVTGAGESASNLTLVSNGILAMAPQVGESTKQLSQGLYMIESAGYHGAAGLAILKAAAEGAKVGNADLGVVSDATTTILNDFGSKGVTAANAVNLLVATVASGKTHMQDLAQSLSQVLPTAASAGVGLSDVMAAMATMTSEGVPAANAATYLRQTILALDAPSSAAKKALASVGLTTQEVSSAMQHSLPDAIALVTDAVGKKFPVGSAAYVAAIKDISGGSKTMQGMLDLSGAHMQTFQHNALGIADAAKKGGTSVTGWAETQKDFNTKMAQAGATLEVIGIKIGQALMPAATALMNHVMPAVTRFSTWASAHGPELVQGIEAIAGALGGALVVAAVAAVAALSPMVFIAAGIAIGVGLLVAGAILLVQHWAQVKSFFESTTPVATAVKAALVGLGAVLVILGVMALPIVITALIGMAAAAWAAVTPILIMAAPFIAIGLAIALVAFGIFELIQHWGAVSAFFQNLWKVVTTWIGNVLGAIGGWFASVGGWFRDRFNAILAFVGGIFLKIYNAIKGPLDAVLAVVVPIFTFIATVIKVVSDIIVKLIEIAWDWIWGKIVAVVSAIRDWLVGEWTIIHNDIALALAVLQALWDAAWRYVSTLVMNAVTPILTWLRNQWHTLSTDVQTLWGVVWGYVSDAWTRILTLIEDKATALKNAILKPFQDVRDEIQAIIKDFANFAIAELNKAITGWAALGNDLGSAINTVAKAVGVSDRVPTVTLPQIPLLASGTPNFGGGLAIVGEQGPEMVHLPAGASVLPAVPTEQLLKFGLGFLRGVGGGAGGIPGFAGGVGGFFGGVGNRIGNVVGGAVSGAKNLASTVGADISGAIGDLQAMIAEGPAAILSKALAASGWNASSLPGAFSGLATGALTTLEGWAKKYLGGLLNNASSSGLTYSGTAGGFANAANMSEFQGYFGDCGETAELLALHVLKGAALTGSDLNNIVHRDQARGWAASNGVVSVGAIQQDLAQFEGIKSQNYGGGAWLSVLNQFAGKKPIIFLYSNAGGGLPGDERGVQWHFNTNLGSLGGGRWLFGDGDNSLAASGKLNIYTSGNLAAANPNAEIVVGMAGGGILNEPVMGMGLVSGGRYLLGEAGPEAVVPLGRRSGVNGGNGGMGGDTYNITVQVVASPDDGAPYQAGQAFGNGFAQGFQQARTQRGQ